METDEELEQREHGAAGSGEQGRHGGGTEVRPWLGELGGIGVFAAGAAYALGYIAQSSYYNAFGMTPEQAGVDKISALLRMTPLAALFGVATPLAVAVILAFGRWVQRNLLERIPIAFLRRLPLAVALPVMLLWPVFAIFDSTSERYYNPPVPGLSDPGNYFLWYGIFLLVVIWLVVAAAWWVFNRVVGSVFAVAGSGVVVVAMACLALWQFVSFPAQVLRDNPSVVSSVRLAMIGIPRAYAEVQWKSSEKPPRYIEEHPNRVYLVLGESSGQYLLYEYCEQKIYTIRPSDANVVRVVPPTRRDEGGQNSWVREVFPC